MRHRKHKIRRYPSALLNSAGTIMLFIGMAMIVPWIINFLEDEDFLPFLVPIAAFIPLGTILVMTTKYPETQSVTEGVLMLALTWFMTIAVGAVPFILFGVDPMDAVFESCSGFTTAGCTIMTDESNWSYGLLLWRSITEWIGGIAIIIIFMYTIPTLGFGTRNLFMNEMSGSGSEDLTLKVRLIGKQFVRIYLLFTILAAVLLAVCGMNIFESVCLALTTVSCGGFTNTTNSLIDASDSVKIIVMVFMFLGGVNFYLHYKAIYQRKITYYKNAEFLLIIALNVALIAIVFSTLYFNNVEVRFLDVMFNCVSATTTAGFAASDYMKWGMIIPVLLMLGISLIGGSSGSAAGGIKASRFIIVCKYIYNNIKRTLHPNATYSIKVNGWSVDSRTVSLSVLIFTMFGLTIFIGTMLFMFTGLNLEISFSTTVACLSSFGTGIYEFGPTGCYVTMSTFVKIIMCVLMWAGRVEILIALIIFTPGFWKEFILSRRSKAKKNIASIRFAKGEKELSER